MKKTFIFIAIFLVLSFTSSALAVVISQKVLNKKTLPDSSVQTITSTLLEASSIDVVKFVDGNVTCYLTQSPKNPDSIEQISCLK